MADNFFAPGIPSNRSIKPVRIPKGFTRLVLQQHDAKRAGTHFDLRLHSGNDAHSWAIRSWPDEANKTFAIQQPTHTADYSDFEGSIDEGYGAGNVRKVMDETVDIVEANDKKVKFVIPGKGEYAMINTGQGWIFLKMKPFIGSVTHKPKYKEVSLDKVHTENPFTVLQPKIDGAHSLIELNPGNKTNRIYSYRVSKRSGTPIEHTHQMPLIRDLSVPKSLGKTVLRAEVFARDPNGNAIPAQGVGGILNSGLIKSRLAQDAGATLVPMAFDVVKFNGRDVSKLPYSERFSILEKINKRIPSIEIPEVAVTPKEKEKLFKRISAGEHPDTREGVVEWNLETGEARKAKVRPEFDVYIKDIDPEKRRFSYSLKKDGPVIGYVGTGINQETNRDMHENPDKYIGRVARIHAQEQFPSGAMRAPSFYSMHVERNLEKTAFNFNLINKLKVSGTPESKAILSSLGRKGAAARQRGFALERAKLQEHMSQPAWIHANTGDDLLK